MADNVPITAGVGTDIATDEVAGDHYQRIKLTDGTPDSENHAIVSAAGALKVDGSAVTQPVSGAVSISGAVSVSNFPATQPVSGSVSVSGSVAVTGPLTDAQLRAVAVAVDGSGVTQPVSAASLPLPTGAATETTLAAIMADVDRLPVLVSGRTPVDGSGVVQPVSLPTMVLSSYNQAGVITINTDLLVLDCASVEAVSIQCTSMGTAGVVTASWSNDNSTFVNASIMTQAGVAAATFNAAGLWTTPVMGRYFRLRLTTATTAGTTTLSVQRLSQANGLPVVSQPVAVAGTVPVSGTLTSAGTTTNTPVTPTTTFTNSAATNNAAFLKASAGTVWSISAFNAGASPVYVKYYNRTTAPTVGTDVPVMVVAVPATQTVMIGGGANGIRFATGIAIAIVTGAADSDNTAVAVNQVKVATSWT